jgi:hypothetical protein
MYYVIGGTRVVFHPVLEHAVAFPTINRFVILEVMLQESLENKSRYLLNSSMRGVVRSILASYKLKR